MRMSFVAFQALHEITRSWSKTIANHNSFIKSIQDVEICGQKSSLIRLSRIVYIDCLCILKSSFDISRRAMGAQISLELFIEHLLTGQLE